MWGIRDKWDIQITKSKLTTKGVQQQNVEYNKYTATLLLLHETNWHEEERQWERAFLIKISDTCFVNDPLISSYKNSYIKI